MVATPLVTTSHVAFIIKQFSAYLEFLFWLVLLSTLSVITVGTWPCPSPTEGTDQCQALFLDFLLTGCEHTNLFLLVQ